MFESQWSKILISKWQDHDIPGQIDKLERAYRLWFIVCAILILGGMAIIYFSSNSRDIAFGLFLGIWGIVSMALIKLWVHIKLSILRIIRELLEQRKVHKT